MEICLEERSGKEIYEVDDNSKGFKQERFGKYGVQKNS